MSENANGFNILMYWLCSFDNILWEKISSGDLDKSQWAITITDEDVNFLYANEAFCQLIGHPRDTLLSMKAFDVLPDETFHRFKNHITNFIEIKSKFRCDVVELDYIQENGRSATVEEIIRLVTHNGKHYIFSLIYLPDQRDNKDNALVSYLNSLETEFIRLKDENIVLKQELVLKDTYGTVIGKSKNFRRVLKAVEQVAPMDTTVLILGETGTGKELLARSIHGLSRRKDLPLIKVNCAALPAGLMEAELFGHVKGAFTGAIQNRKGRFELADKGTLFLDEIGELPMEFQTKLLRVLQEGELNRVGDGKNITVDVRIIAATNRDLEKEVKKGRFREDLFYRLNVFPITSPPLRKRREDIPSLIRYFLEHYNRKLGKHVDIIPRATLNQLLSYHWPGNIRELENILERAIILAKDQVLSLEGLSKKKHEPVVEKTNPTLEEVQRNYILKILHQTGWRVSGENGAANILGLNPKTLESRMKKLSIHRPTHS
ncbi:MAG: sigma 54-interacting transcriptional regulator [Desulfobacterium sp.]